jgi:hypothetical protein
MQSSSTVQLGCLRLLQSLNDSAAMQQSISNAAMNQQCSNESAAAMLARP